MLAVITASGEASRSLYLRRLEDRGDALGVAVVAREAGEPTELEALVREANHDARMSGVMIMKPLPTDLSFAELADLIDPVKDVEGIGATNAGLLALDRPRYVPSTADAILTLLRDSGIAMRSAHVAVVGRSATVGRPVAWALLGADATVSVAHRATRALAPLTGVADIIVLCAGVPRLLTGDMIRRGAVVIDAGMTETPEGVVGDADPSSVPAVAGALTPPGRLGPLTATLLLRNVVAAAEAAF
jgi:methylenetetrahydrofolate dehydrogenase (NADP+)/methenyltetrahydrofolate cyclohydrolase